MIFFPYNSRRKEYKSPFGAIQAGQEIVFNFPVSKSLSLYGVSIIVTKNGENPVNYPLIESGGDDKFTNFSAKIEITTSGIYWYYFEVYEKHQTTFVGRDAYGKAVQSLNPQSWQITVYDKIYPVSQLASGGIVYHIFVDRFSKGKSENIRFDKKGKLKEWKDEITVCDSDGVYRANDFYGGNFQGIIDKLDYLEELNVKLIYLSPIFKSFSNHRYDTADYMEIDELLGGEKDFIKLIEECKKRGIGIMLDGVFNHTGADSIYFNKFNTFPEPGAYQSQNSKYFKWFDFESFPDKYNCWWGITVTPTVNKNNPDYRNFIFGKDGVIEKWNSKGISGWRLDVVDELPVDFTDGLISKIKEKKNLTVIGEVWEDASTKISYGTMRPYLLGKQLDGTMNYPFKNAVLDFTMDRNADRFKIRIMNIVENYPRHCLDNSMNFLSTHDTYRALNALSGLDLSNTTKVDRLKIFPSEEVFNMAVKRLKFASAVIFTLPGTPTVYYGEEAGMWGFDDPINRRPFPWDNINTDILNHYNNFAQIRKKYKQEFKGFFEFENISRLLVYNYSSDRGKLKIIANMSDETGEYSLKKGSRFAISEKNTPEILKIAPLEVRVVFCPERN